jgi:hypothetical protein
MATFGPKKFYQCMPKVQVDIQKMEVQLWSESWSHSSLVQLILVEEDEEEEDENHDDYGNVWFIPLPFPYGKRLCSAQYLKPKYARGAQWLEWLGQDSWQRQQFSFGSTSRPVAVPPDFLTNGYLGLFPEG